MTVEKKSASKRTVWPPRLTPKRKRALALLKEWADKHLELIYGAGGIVAFTGTINSLDFDNRGSSFLFRNDNGVHAIMSTDLYEMVEVNEIPGLPVTVAFSRRSNQFCDSFSLRPEEQRPNLQQDVTRAMDIFKRWEKFDTTLMVYVGDDMRATLSRSKVKHLSGRVLFTVADTETAHIIMPEQVHLVQIETKGDQIVVILYNKKSHTVFMATNGAESSEDMIDRFMTQTSLLQ